MASNMLDTVLNIGHLIPGRAWYTVRVSSTGEGGASQQSSLPKQGLIQGGGSRGSGPPLFFLVISFYCCMGACANSLIADIVIETSIHVYSSAPGYRMHTTKSLYS